MSGRLPACVYRFVVIPAQAEESSGLISHSRSAGMPIHRRHNRTRHPAKSAILHASTALSRMPALETRLAGHGRLCGAIQSRNISSRSFR